MHIIGPFSDTSSEFKFKMLHEAALVFIQSSIGPESAKVIPVHNELYLEGWMPKTARGCFALKESKRH